MSKQFGNWSWYLGVDDADDEMLDCHTREKALKEGCSQFGAGETFYIVEARFFAADEREMAEGNIDAALFAQTRNGEFVSVKRGET